MVELVVYSFVLALLALWIWPLLFNLSNLDYLLTNRDEAAPESQKFQRAKRAAANFQESYPVFLAISIIARGKYFKTPLNTGASFLSLALILFRFIIICFRILYFVNLDKNVL